MTEQPNALPWSYRNWHAALSGEAKSQEYEVPLYSAAEIHGDLPGDACSPYDFLNGHAFGGQQALAQVAFVRVRVHLGDEHLPEVTATDTSSYHGGTPLDELAALASLVLGVRIRPGLPTRVFWSGDPLGRPVADLRPPTLPPPTRHGIVLPSALGPGQLAHALAPYWATFPSLTGGQAMALVRAARQYQAALWIVESDPHLAWLLLVSAVESLALHDQLSETDPLELLRTAQPKLCAVLDSKFGPAAVEHVASALHPMLKATSRFIRFLTQHAPPPPSPRPARDLQLDWSPKSLKQAFSRIYDYRSRALHDGTPFPDPMCTAPAILTEVPIAPVASSFGGHWRREDTPMLLHTFEFIARRAILSWWSACAGVTGQDT